jgi:hypothetical protein
MQSRSGECPYYVDQLAAMTSAGNGGAGQVKPDGGTELSLKMSLRMKHRRKRDSNGMAVLGLLYPRDG